MLHLLFFRWKYKNNKLTFSLPHFLYSITHIFESDFSLRYGLYERKMYKICERYIPCNTPVLIIITVGYKGKIYKSKCYSRKIDPYYLIFLLPTTIYDLYKEVLSKAFGDAKFFWGARCIRSKVVLVWGPNIYIKKKGQHKN